MIIIINLIFCIFIYIRGLFIYSIKRKHLLLILLSLEFIVLSLYIRIFFYLSLYDFEYFFRLIFLTFSVCEGVLGLSLMVLLIRTHGNDYFQVLRVL